MFSSDIHDLAHRLVETSTKNKRRLATAESCTGGLIAGAITEIAGASSVIESGFITYSDNAKSNMLGVPPEIIEEHGAVSAEVAEHMAEGALERARADFAVSATGIAGPGGGSTAKPVGLVYIGLARSGGSVFHYKCLFKGDRGDVRMQTVREALKLLLSAVEE
jgi:nicotinamide-nucleotide amidase